MSMMVEISITRQMRTTRGGSRMANGKGAGRAAQARDISEIQTRYILRNLKGAAVYPPRPTGQEGPDTVEFIYRRRHLLTRDRDLRAVLSVLRPGPLKT